MISSDKILDHYQEDIFNVNPESGVLLPTGEYIFPAPLSLMRAIKRSHLHKDIHWEKNIGDYHRIKSNTSELDDFCQEVFWLRSGEVSSRVGDRKINLNKSNEEFFGQSEKALGRIYPFAKRKPKIIYILG